MALFNYNSGLIQGFSVDTEKEPDAIYLNVISEYYNLNYRIIGDTSFTLDYIKDKLISVQNVLQNQDSNTVFEITEYLERMYIYVTYPDGTTDKYTATKV